MEYLDIYNRYGEKTNEVIERDEAHRKGICHRTIHLWIANARNEILIQQFSENDESAPNMWYVSVSGHITASESIKDALIRETEEELGFNISAIIDSVKYLYTFNENQKDGDGFENEFIDVFLLQTDISFDQIKLNENEGQAIKYIPYSDLRNIIINKDATFCHHDMGYKMLLAVLDDMFLSARVTFPVAVHLLLKDKLKITPASLADLPALEEIEKECDAYFNFDPPCASEHNRRLRECIAIGDIIPDVTDEQYVKENYKLDCIWHDDELIGWLAYYLEYQQKDTVYLSLLYIKESHRKGGIGTQIVEVLVHTLSHQQYKSIKTHCSLRNALALRFWVSNCFDRIIEIECDGNITPGNFGGVGLMRRL